MRAAALALALALGTIPAANAQETHTHRGPHDATVHHDFDDVAHWARVFDDPARDAWQKPDVVFDVLGLKAGAWVADLGAATGYFTVRLARRVGPDGKVYGIDVEPSLVAYLRERAAKEKLPNVEAVLAAPDDPRLPDASVDLVLIVDTWHHIDARLAYLDRLRRVLRPGGRVAIVDFKPGDLPVGPPPEHRLAREAVTAEFAEAGWSPAGESDALPYQFVLVFTPRSASPRERDRAPRAPEGSHRE